MRTLETGFSRKEDKESEGQGIRRTRRTIDIRGDKCLHNKMFNYD